MSEQNKKAEEANNSLGAKSLFDVDHPFNRFMSKLGTLFVANLLFIIGCLPIVTIGTSLAALNKVMYEYDLHDDIKVSSLYFKAYKESLVSGIVGFILGIGFLSMGAVGLFYTLHSPTILVMFLGFFFFGLMTFASLCFLTFYFGIISRFENDLLGHIKNGIIVGVAYVRWGVLIWLLWIISVGLFILFPFLVMYIGFMWAMFGFSLLALITTKIHGRVFRLVKYRETTDEY